jgi:hypothetical protein
MKYLMKQELIKMYEGSWEGLPQLVAQAPDNARFAYCPVFTKDFARRGLLLFWQLRY